MLSDEQNEELNAEAVTNNNVKASEKDRKSRQDALDDKGFVLFGPDLFELILGRLEFKI